MDTKLMIFAMLVFFCLCKRGDAQGECSLADLQVRQTTLQKQVGGYPEYFVEVNNTCICTQSNVKLLCPGFNSSIRVDPSIISPDPDGKLCTLINGDPVWNTDVIKFNYAWSTKFSFGPVSSDLACS